MLQQTDKSCYLDVVAGEAKSVDDPSAYPGAVGEVVVQLVLPKGEGLLVVAASTLAARHCSTHGPPDLATPR
jgi:hypothetical protein